MKLDKKLYKKSAAAPFDISIRSKNQTTRNHFWTYTAMAQRREFQLVSFGFGWLAILPYYKRISFVFNALIPLLGCLGDDAGDAEKLKRGYESLDFFIAGMVKWQVSDGKLSLILMIDGSFEDAYQRNNVEASQCYFLK